MTAKQIRDLEQERNAYKQLYEQLYKQIDEQIDEQAAQDCADEHVELHKKINILLAFVESITDAVGPYPDIDGTAVVYDAFRVLRKVKGVSHGG